MPRSDRADRGTELDDDSTLRSMGIRPVLTRRMSPFGTFAISFSVISILSGCMTLFGFGMLTGGPVVMLWGWVIVGAMVMLVGAGLALGGLVIWAVERRVSS